MKLISIDSTNDFLIDKLREGDEMAAKEIYNQYAKAMYNTLIRITNNQMAAEDLLQEAFIKAFRKIETYKKEATFGSWLKRIVINTGLEYLRNKKVDFQSLENEQIQEIENTDDQNDVESLENKVKQVNDAIQSLPAGTRNVVNLYLLEGYTHDEISEYLGITKSTSKTQYMRGKQLIKQKLKGL